jgi:hypothetical protein
MRSCWSSSWRTRGPGPRWPMALSTALPRSTTAPTTTSAPCWPPSRSLAGPEGAMGVETTAQHPTGKTSRRQLFKYGGFTGAAATVGPILPAMTTAAHAHGLPRVLPAPNRSPGGSSFPTGRSSTSSPRTAGHHDDRLFPAGFLRRAARERLGITPSSASTASSLAPRSPLAHENDRPRPGRRAFMRAVRHALLAAPAGLSALPRLQRATRPRSHPGLRPRPDVDGRAAPGPIRRGVRAAGRPGPRGLHDQDPQPRP